MKARKTTRTPIIQKVATVKKIKKEKDARKKKTKRETKGELYKHVFDMFGLGFTSTTPPRLFHPWWRWRRRLETQTVE